MRYKYAFAIAGALFVAGCVMVGLKHWGNIEKPRAEAQQQRGKDIVQLTDTITSALPEDAAPAVVDSVQVIRDIGADIEKDAVKSERYAMAGKKILGPPPEEVLPNTTGEDGVLAQLEQVADTVGKVRNVVNTGKRIVQGGGAGGGLGAWATGGGLVAILTAVGTLGEVGRRKLKDQDQKRKADQEAQRAEHQKTREEAEKKMRELQEERDRQQDQKFDAMMTLINQRMAAVEDAVNRKDDALPAKPEKA